MTGESPAMAQKMGKTADYETFSKRAHYYKNYFDSSIHFIRPKLEDGSWRTPYDPARSIHGVGDFCEGNGWQYDILRSARSVWIDQPVWR